MKHNIDYSLYLVTDRDLMISTSFLEAVESAVKGGCTVVQLREKDASSLTFYDQAKKIKDLTDHYHVPLIINDRVDIAIAIDADGIHVGQSDIPAEVVRRMIGPEKILGVSAATLEEAELAQKAGADYLGVGAMFATGTKKDARPVSMEELKKIRSAVPLPIVVIGGISHATVPLFASSGINGFAVVSAIIAASDVEQAAKEMRMLADQVIHSEAR